MNAIELMSSLQTRVLRIKTELGQSSTAHVSVEDTGAGIKPSSEPAFSADVYDQSAWHGNGPFDLQLII